MNQRRLCNYFKLACTHKDNDEVNNSTFLRLPYTVRRQIYEAADADADDCLTREHSIDLNDIPKPSPLFQISNATVINLLLTCRAVYTELSTILYSTNTFFIRYQDRRNFQSLSNLSSTALSALRDLTIELNITVAEYEMRCCWANEVDRVDNRPFNPSSYRYREAVAAWEHVARYILPNCDISNLRLHLSCDVENLECAKRVVEPLLAIDGTFAQCDVRLGRDPHPVLREIAENASIRASGKRVDSLTSPFRFLDLPAEIRLQILMYTDLITPLLEVEWCPERRFGLHYARGPCQDYDDEWEMPCCEPESDAHYVFQFRRCEPRAASNYGSCFCRRRHASYSSACRCWAPPTALFLVCHALRDLATEVFFSGNRFIITSSERCDKPATRTPESLEALKFFTQAIPHNALRYLRFLEVVFPPFEEDYLRSTEPAYQEWLQTIAIMKDGLNLPAFTLRIYMADIDAYDDGYGLPSFGRGITREQGTVIYQVYRRILQPLTALTGLARFFVHARWPFAHAKAAVRRERAEPGFVDGHEKRLNRVFEKWVMGDLYDSSVFKEPRISQWLEASTQDPFSA